MYSAPWNLNVFLFFYLFSDLYNVSCLEMDTIVDIASKTSGIFGARMTGGGFGGCVVALVREAYKPLKP